MDGTATYIVDKEDPLYATYNKYQDYELQNSLDTEMKKYVDARAKCKTLLETIDKEKEYAQHTIEVSPLILNYKVSIETTRQKLTDVQASYEQKKEELKARLLEEFMSSLDRKVENLLLNDRRSIEAVKTKLTETERKVQILQEDRVSKIKATKKSKVHVAAEHDLQKAEEQLEAYEKKIAYIRHFVKMRTKRLF